ncbi:glycosyltransferase [Ktedonosporobacter rubrisoli]|uniref:Glycosyltransferase n=1 Tax=Ktedonosporobacter rubrisoli TaxID=2509675 RepID=A0A4P6JMA7_KTERU|nr:glycosyltransferase [Ktedonosporobacter rubrisoli]QBD76375.1 glycosyltransferase [Ktedonosporobacter rubrisoli]
MIETSQRHSSNSTASNNITRPLAKEPITPPQNIPERPSWLQRVVRFGVVGGVNTLVDLLILNFLLFMFPTRNAFMLLAYNSLAYALGAINSFWLNKYWTFGHKQGQLHRELPRFAITTLCGIVWSNCIIWLASNALHPLLLNATVWANTSKIVAIAGTACISYLGMQLWVFVNHKSHTKHLLTEASIDRSNPLSSEPQALFAMTHEVSHEDKVSDVQEDEFMLSHVPGLSVVLPAYNEEQVIATTLLDVLKTLTLWGLDFEVLVVNDGSVDRTGNIVAELAREHPRVRLITHETNQGYGAALVSGFQAATKALTFFMDSDGQFDIRELRQFFPFLKSYDAVLGYRIARQDTWMRKLNAWGWKCLIGWVLGLHVRDIDCAFKLLRTEFLQRYPLQTRGAMINAELLYRLRRAGYTYWEVGVHHLPRRAGRATGAQLQVILRALSELFVYARIWRREEQAQALAKPKSLSTQKRA